MYNLTPQSLPSTGIGSSASTPAIHSDSTAYQPKHRRPTAPVATLLWDEDRDLPSLAACVCHVENNVMWKFCPVHHPDTYAAIWTTHKKREGFNDF